MIKRIGDFFIDQGVLTNEQVQLVVRYSKEHGLRFGAAAQEMGLISEATLRELFGPHHQEIDFFTLDSKYFPLVTRNLFKTEILLKFGVLPLGFKTETKFFVPQKVLNLGFLNPEKLDQMKTLLEIAQQSSGEKISSIRPYLIVAPQFIEILRDHYQMTDPILKSQPRSHLDETLQLFLQEGSDGAR